jgi:hypothetical protein
MLSERALHEKQQQRQVSWKGKTFSQITTIVKKNLMDSSVEYDIYRPNPIKHYRKEIASVDPNTTCNPRAVQTIIRDLETPGGSIIRTNFNANGETIPSNQVGIDGGVPKGLVNTLDIQYNESKTARPSCESCDKPIPGGDTHDIRSLSQQDNARRRVRSSGMNRPSYNENTHQKRYFSSTSEYLHNRNRKHSQNTFHQKHANANADNNEYRSNTFSHCGSQDYVPVIYKPSNAKFAHQGAVDSSSRLARLKYDTITNNGATYIQAFDKYGLGNATANALSYGVPAGGYTIKDKLGYPLTRTPIFPKNGNPPYCHPEKCSA